MARVLFMGTPHFALPTLEALHEAHEVIGVVTRPDKPAGRGQRLRPPPVKQWALAHGLEVLQPPRLSEPRVLATLRGLKPEVIVVAAYGQILPSEVLNLPPAGCLNVHASLLPKHRGAAPIPAAILAGDRVTGVTIMLMDEGLDTGPILAQRACPITPQDTTASLTEKLAQMGADLLTETLPRWLAGHITPLPQDEAQASYCPLISKGDGLIDWMLPAEEIWRRVRAYNPWPSAYTFWKGRLLKIWRARPLPEETTGEPGTVLDTPLGPAISTGKGLLLLEEVQLAGKRAMPAAEFVRGQRGFVGAKLGR